MNPVNYGLKAILLFLSLIPTLAGAALTVIYDSGDTRPIAPFLKAFNSTAFSSPQNETNRPGQSNQTPQLSHPPQLGVADIESLLPIRSPGLTPGLVQPQNHDRPFAQPFFLIGSDEMSKQWLLDNRDRLKEVGAVGMLVQADTLEDLLSIAALSAGLSIMPASSTDLADALKISHYPVLITSHGIEQ